ncbi:MAG: AAA family ATPase [Paracoccaceae bacterium]|nr:AAA family ATPase [Paracoccaceae bacterium]
MFETIENSAATALQSEFFLGGLALALMGIALGVLRMVWTRSEGLIARRLSVVVTVDNRVAEFRHLLNWLEDSGAFTRVRRFRLTWTGGRFDRRSVYAPSTGRCWFILDGQFVWLDRDLDDKAKSGQNGTPLETLTLTLPFGRRRTIERWIAKGAEREAAAHRIGPSLHIHVDNYWSHVGDVVRRPISTLVADDDRFKRLLDDVRWFYGARDWYVERGVPWRRGYLLHGPPGTGKSSVIRAIASELDHGLAIMDIGRKSLSDDQLAEAMAEAPKDAVLVFEDVDAAFNARQAEDAEGISFSGLLNAIDGVAAQEGRALFMTTNHVERLDPALIRPGRADVHAELGLVGAGAAKALFLRFFPGEATLADLFADQLGTTRLAPAELQGWLLANAGDAKAAAEASDLAPPLPVAAE